MTGDEFRQALSNINATQAEFSRLMGVTPRAIQLWLTDARAVPRYAEIMLRYMAARGLTVPKVIEAVRPASGIMPWLLPEDTPKDRTVALLVRHGSTYRRDIATYDRVIGEWVSDVDDRTIAPDDVAGFQYLPDLPSK